jgi:hypothetical protein
MSIRNVTYHGITQFLAGLLDHQKNKEVGDWVSCRMLAGTNIKQTFLLGGVACKCDTGMELLLSLVSAAKTGKLTKEECDFVANFLISISYRFEHLKTLYALELVDAASVATSVVNTPEATPEATPEVDYSQMTVEQLREACDAKGVTYHPASKEKKLIELLTKA